MFQKVLVPLDRTKEAERILPLIATSFPPSVHIVLLNVIPPGVAVRSDRHPTLYAKDQENGERKRSMAYLKVAARNAGESSRLWSCAVKASTSVVETILQCAEEEEVDLIMMYTHGRRSLKRTIVGSVPMKVQRRASMAVHIILPQDLVNDPILTH